MPEPLMASTFEMDVAHNFAGLGTLASLVARGLDPWEGRMRASGADRPSPGRVDAREPRLRPQVTQPTMNPPADQS